SSTSGFCPPGVEPWLPPAADHRERNVALRDVDPRSELALFRLLVQVRRGSPALSLGSYRRIATADDEVLAYLREHGGERMLVVLNFGAAPTTVDVSEAAASAELLCSTTMDRFGAVALEGLLLGAHEGVVVRPG